MGYINFSKVASLDRQAALIKAINKQIVIYREAKGFFEKAKAVLILLGLLTAGKLIWSITPQNYKQEAIRAVHKYEQVLESKGVPVKEAEQAIANTVDVAGDVLAAAKRTVEQHQKKPQAKPVPTKVPTAEPTEETTPEPRPQYLEEKERPKHDWTTPQMLEEGD